MIHSEFQEVLLAVAREHYKELWRLLEDLETVLWNIKNLNDDMEMPASEE